VSWGDGSVRFGKVLYKYVERGEKKRGGARIQETRNQKKSGIRRGQGEKTWAGN